VCPPDECLVLSESSWRGGVHGTVGKLLARRGAWAWFRSVWTYGGKIIEFQSFSMNEKFKI